MWIQSEGAAGFYLLWACLVLVALFVLLDGEQPDPWIPAGVRRWLLPGLLILASLGTLIPVFFRRRGRSQAAAERPQVVLEGGDVDDVKERAEAASEAAEELNQLEVVSEQTDEAIDGLGDGPVRDDLSERLRKRGVLGS